MTASLPPELIAPEDREARAEELEERVAREWVRFAVTDAVLLWLPFAAVGLLYVAGAISHGVLVASGVVAFLGMGALVSYWVLGRIRPLQREIEALRSVR